MVSTRLPTSKSTSPFSNPLITVPNTLITIGIIVTCMFSSFFQFPSKVEVLLFTLSVLYYYYYYYSLEVFFLHQRKLMVFHWRLSDSKSPQVSRTLLSILAVFNNTVVWMVSTRPPTSKSSRPCDKPLVTVPKAPISIGIIVTFMFHSFYLYYYFLFFKSSLQVFHSCIRWWSFSGVCVIANLLRSPGLFSVFWPI